MFVLTEREETDNALVATILFLEGLDEAALASELDKEIVTGGLLLDSISEFFQTPSLCIYDLTAVLGDNTLEFAKQLLKLSLRKNGGGNENGFVIVHNCFV